MPNSIALDLRRSGLIRHASFSSELLARIGTVHSLIGKYLGVNLEQFEIGFMRDETPELEVARWCRIAAALTDFHRKYIGQIRLPDSEEKMLIVALIEISKGVQNVEKLGMPIAVGNRLLAC